MADNPEDIIAHIGISGQDDIIAALGEVGKAGEDAFSRLAESAGQIGAAFAGVAAAIAGIGTGLGIFAESSAKATQATGDLAAATGESIENISAMQGALSSVGGSSENLGFALRRLAFEVTSQWDQIQKAVQDRSQQVVQAQLKVKESSLGLITAQEAALKAQQSIGGGPLPGVPQTPRTPFQQQQDQRAEAELKYKQAVEARDEAVKAANDRERNDINNVVEAIGKVIAGEQTLADTATKINPTLDNVFKGIIGNSGEAAAAIKDYDGNLAQLALSSPKVLDVLFKTADFFKHSKDDALNAALGLRELGRGSGTVVSALQNLGSEGLKQLTDRFKNLGFETTRADENIARKFNTTLFSLQYELSAVKDQISTPLQGAFTKGLEDLQGFVEKNRGALVKWAESFAKEITPAIMGFFHAIEGLAASLAGIKLDPNTDAGKWKATFDPIIEVLAKTGEEIHKVVAAAKELKDLLPSENSIREKVGLPALTTPKPGEAQEGGTPEDFKKALGVAGGVIGVNTLLRLLRGGSTGAAVGGEAAATATTGVAVTGGEAAAGAAGAAGGGLLARLAPGLGALYLAAQGLAELVTNTKQALTRTFLPQDLRSSAVEEKAKDLTAPASFADRFGAAGEASADKQQEAAKIQDQAADKQLAAAKGISPPSGFGKSPPAPGELPSGFKGAPSVLGEHYPYAVGVTPEGGGLHDNQTLSGFRSVPVDQSATAQLLRQMAPDLAAERAYQNSVQIGTPQLQGNQGAASNLDAVKTATDGLPDKLESFKTSLDSFVSSISQLVAQFSQPAASQGHAEGGMIHGPGGPTDDKVPMWGSAGEGVITASSVEHYGGESFINSINNKTLNLPKFSIGGLVEAFSAPLANYATGRPISANGPFGGPNSARTPIVLNIGGEQVHGLEATDKAAEQISKIAVGRAVRSGYSQSKSSWYRGS